MGKDVKVKDIVHFLGKDIIRICGNIENKTVSHLRDAEHVDNKTLNWINPVRKDQQQIAESSKAEVIVTTTKVEYSKVLKKQDKVLLQVTNPKLSIAKVGNQFFVHHPEPTIHKTAIIHPDAIIGKNVFIGPYSIIGKCSIGNNVIIHSHVTLYDNVTVKNNVIIQAGAVIGTDGLGCEREDDGRLIKFPHFGGVVIEDNVEIGACCQIAKGALSNTIIGQGSKINVGCYIAHNVVIGKNVWISGQANIAGSAKINDNVTIFINAIIREQRTIGEGATIGMGAVVTKDVPAGETWVGNPARKIR